MCDSEEPPSPLGEGLTFFQEDQQTSADNGGSSQGQTLLGSAEETKTQLFHQKGRILEKKVLIKGAGYLFSEE